MLARLSESAKGTNYPGASATPQGSPIRLSLYGLENERVVSRFIGRVQQGVALIIAFDLLEIAESRAFASFRDTRQFDYFLSFDTLNEHLGLSCLFFTHRQEIGHCLLNLLESIF